MTTNTARLAKRAITLTVVYNHPLENPEAVMEAWRELAFQLPSVDSVQARPATEQDVATAPELVEIKS